MNTPLCDFITQYISSDPVRLHMPGHKGKGPLGIEIKDITEIEGADVLYRESGILKESQTNASLLFDSAKTLYSTEGSTLCIRAMLTLAVKHARESGKEPLIAAGRNAHKSFLTTCALLDLDPLWIFPAENSGILSCKITPKDLKDVFQREKKPTAIYITSPDYLGNLCDVAALSKICKDNDALLLVDNAHGSYLRFLPETHHPINLGADLCCDSAHKTLPVLTGGAYLHVGKSAPETVSEQAEEVMLLFASTSPSYLILQSLDACNLYLAERFKNDLCSLFPKIEALKKSLRRLGIPTVGDEPMKITLLPKPFGYTGSDLADLLRDRGYECEFSDPDHLVMMISPMNEKTVLDQLLSFFQALSPGEPILSFPPKATAGKKVLTPREAMLSPSKTIPIEEAKGEILSEAGVTCPPAVPIAICGEQLGKDEIDAFSYYGILTIKVKK